MADEVKTLIEEIGTAFEEFKQTNDERLEKMAKGEAVAELEQKLERINTELGKLEEIRADIDDVAKKAARSGTGSEESQAIAEHREAYAKFLRKGHDAGLAELQEKAVQIGVDADGGFAVPQDLDSTILDIERSRVAMRRLADVRQVSNEEYKRLVNVGGAAAGWVGETDARPETASPQLAALSPFFGELYANPASTQKALDDVFFDVENWIANEIGTVFAEQEEGAFVAGDGISKPKGLLAYPVAATGDDVRPFGTLQAINSGAAADVTADGILDLVYSVKSGYRSVGSFLLSSPVLAAVRKLKDSNGDYLWQPGLQAGEPSTLLGYAVEESDFMPAIAADSLPVAFGDFQRGYMIVDVRGTRVLRDPFTNKPYVHFYTTKRMGGMLTDSNAIKLLKVAV